MWVACLGCESAPRTDARAPDEPAPAVASDDAPFTQTISGTALSIEMLPLRDRASVWMSSTEITWDVYDAFVFELDKPSAEANAGTDAIARPSKPYILMDRGFGHAGYPAISVNHTGAAAFCAWLSEKTGRSYRLPTESEWEIACRAGATDGDDAATLGDRAWFKDNAGRKTHPVATRKPNAWGFFDMSGNAAEWCVSDRGEPIVRGGSYRDGVEGLRVEKRVLPQKAWNASDPQIPKSQWWLADGGFIGFRIVCEGP